MTDWNRPLEPGPVKLEYDKPGPCVTLPLDMVETLLLIADSVGGLSDQCKLTVAEVRREVDQVKAMGAPPP